MTWISKRASIVSLPEHLHDPNALDWESLGWIELNPAPGTAQMFGKSRIKMNELDQIKWKQWMEWIDPCHNGLFSLSSVLMKGKILIYLPRSKTMEAPRGSPRSSNCRG
eukprot:1024681_1